MKPMIYLKRDEKVCPTETYVIGINVDFVFCLTYVIGINVDFVFCLTYVIGINVDFVRQLTI
jgi:hypothetical protein